jgi:hypothetical protein
MSTRHASVKGAYPFISPATAEGISVSGGILDVYLVIQGDPDITGAPAVLRNTIEMINYIPSGSTSEITFLASQGTDRWFIQFIVPNDLSGDQIGEIEDDGLNDCHGVLVFRSAELDNTLVSYAENMEAEPSRAEWHTEHVQSMSFSNITRCNGEEDDSILIPVTTVAGGELKLENGYNVTVAYADGQITLSGIRGTGKGLAPDLGDSAGCPPTPANEDEFVTTVNGLAPINGDIPIRVSNNLGLQQTATGQINIIRKQ